MSQDYGKIEKQLWCTICLSAFNYFEFSLPCSRKGMLNSKIRHYSMDAERISNIYKEIRQRLCSARLKASTGRRTIRRDEDQALHLLRLEQIPSYSLNRLVSQNAMFLKDMYKAVDWPSTRETGRDLTQSCNKSPYTHKNPKSNGTTKKLRLNIYCRPT